MLILWIILVVYGLGFIHHIRWLPKALAYNFSINYRPDSEEWFMGWFCGFWLSLVWPLWSPIRSFKETFLGSIIADHFFIDSPNKRKQNKKAIKQEKISKLENKALERDKRIAELEAQLGIGQTKREQYV